MTSLLRLDNIHKSFGETSVLSGISMDVSHGEVVALIGASGSGKSTLLRCINLLEQIDDGQIWLSGDDITDPRANPDAIRARIGVVFQQFNLFPHLSVLHNITLSLIQVKKMKKECGARSRPPAAGPCGFRRQSQLVSRSPLRGGNRQRVALARAIACKPEVLLLDEITSALDPELVDEVLELVRTLKEEGTTIIMATHEMAFARDVADRVFFISGGVIAEGGPAVDVLQNPQDARTQAFLQRFRGQ